MEKLEQDYFEEHFEDYVKFWKRDYCVKDNEKIFNKYKDRIKELLKCEIPPNNFVEYKNVKKIFNKKELKILLKIKAIFKANNQYYYFDEFFADRLLIASLRIKNSVFCYQTACNIIFDTSICLSKIDMTVNNWFKYLYYKVKYKGVYNLYYANKKKFNMGISEYTTWLSNKVLAYQKERTICELLKYQDKYLDGDLWKCIDSYFYFEIDQEDSSFEKLMKYAKMFDVENEVIDRIKNPEYKGYSFTRDIQIDKKE